MMLLLAGSTPIVRSALAEKIAGEHPQWRHLAIEELTENHDKLLAIICNCSSVMQKEGYHLILSLEDATKLLPLLREELEGNFLSMHLGEPDEDIADTFDHIINTANATIYDIYEFLRPLLEQPTDA